MNKRKINKKNIILFVSSFVVAFIIVSAAAYFLWLRPLLKSPVSESLDYSTDQDSRFPELEDLYDPVNEDPVCGDQEQMLILAAGIDYRGSDYLYGLADVIRLIHVDFTVPRINVVAIPRAMLVEVPESLRGVDGPILLNQAYFFGTPGMGKYDGGGYGAGALAETIYFNFNLKSDHYLVIDFLGFQKLIDILGGIEVDLPMAIDAESAGYFPAGKQTLDGEQALRLARTRKNYSDNIRITNQSIILEGIFEKLKSPDVLFKFPELMSEFMETVLTDGSLSQIPDALCLIENLDSSNIHFYQPDDSLITAGWKFIPTMSKEMNIYYWNESFISWLNDSLFSQN